MKKIYATHTNHFDLLWRRTWEMPCEYEGKRWLSYSELEELVIARNIELAETGRGAYQVEQALTMRKYLEQHPADLKRMKALYQQGLWEMHGSGEAIIDVNLCNFETMIRNMASGVRYCKDVLEMPPLSAYHADGFGSSAQFPQVISGCGFDVVLGLTYHPRSGAMGAPTSSITATTSRAATATAITGSPATSAKVPASICRRTSTPSSSRLTRRMSPARQASTASAPKKCCRTTG